MNKNLRYEIEMWNNGDIDAPMSSQFILALIMEIEKLENSLSHIIEPPEKYEDDIDAYTEYVYTVATNALMSIE